MKDESDVSRGPDQLKGLPADTGQHKEALDDALLSQEDRVALHKIRRDTEIAKAQKEKRLFQEQVERDRAAVHHDPALDEALSGEFKGKSEYLLGKQAEVIAPVNPNTQLKCAPQFQYRPGAVRIDFGTAVTDLIFDVQTAEQFLALFSQHIALAKSSLLMQANEQRKARARTKRTQ